MRKLIVVAVVLIAVAWSGFLFQVPETEYAIVLRFGRPVRAIDQAGLYGKLPFVDTLQRIDNRVQVLDPDLPADDVEFLMADKHNVVVHGFVVWKVEDPRQFYKSVGDVHGAEFRLTDMMRAQVGTTLSSYPFSGLVSVPESGAVGASVKLSAVMDEITEKLAVAARESLGVRVLAFRIKRLTLPNNNKTSTYQRMEAERRSVTERIRSEGDELAKQITIKGELERARLLNEATLEAERIRGEADAEANRIYAEAYGRDPEFYELWESLNSYRKMFGKDDQMLVPADHWLLEALQRQPSAPVKTPGSDGQ